MSRLCCSQLARLTALSFGLAAACGPSQSESPDVSRDLGPAGCAGEELESTICLSEVTGQVVDEAGRPVSDLAVTVCGPICFRGTTDEAGNFGVDVNHFVNISEYSVQAHGSPGASTFYHHLSADLDDGRFEAGVLRVLSLPADGPVLVTKLDLGGETAPSQTATSGAMTLSIASGTVVRLSVGDALKGEDGARFRALELTSAQAEEFAPELSEARVFATGPFEADFSSELAAGPQVSVRVENTLDWPPGADVEVLALGTYLDPEWLTPSEFESIGMATVSSDGVAIDFPPSAQEPGLRHLTWIAFRLAE